MEKPGLSFLAMNFILLFTIIGFILLAFDLHTFAFVLELGVLVIFIFILAFAMFVVYHSMAWGWTILGATLILMLLNTLFISLLTNTLETAHMTVVFFSMLGLIIVFFKLRETTRQDYEGKGTGEKAEKTGSYYSGIDKMEPEEAQKPEKEAPKTEKTFTPGKFVASAKANRFHSPKCDWAKKISKENRVWFNSGEEAKSKGFEADKCVAS